MKTGRDSGSLITFAYYSEQLDFDTLVFTSRTRAERVMASMEAKCLSTITEREEAERMSSSSGMSESTVLSSTSGRWSQWANEKMPQSRRPGDVMFMPWNIQSPVQQGFPDGPIVHNVPSRGISRVSIPLSQLHNTRRPSFDDGAPPPLPQQAPSIPPIEPPPGFQPVQAANGPISPRPIVHFAEDPSVARKKSVGSNHTSDTSYATTPDGSPPLGGSFPPQWPLPMPEKDRSANSSANPSVVEIPKHNSQWSDLPAYPGTPGSRFSWPMKPQEVARSWFTRWFIEWWMFEILAWVFSFFCIAAVVAVLFYFDGRELSEWPFSITLNAFIAIFAGFAKSALLVPTAEALGQLKWDWYRNKPKKMMDFEILDSASRGPWGSLVLLTRTKGM